MASIDQVVMERMEDHITWMESGRYIVMDGTYELKTSV
jgi:hypothetical protein